MRVKAIAKLSTGLLEVHSRSSNAHKGLMHAKFSNRKSDLLETPLASKELSSGSLFHSEFISEFYQTTKKPVGRRIKSANKRRTSLMIY